MTTHSKNAAPTRAAGRVNKPSIRHNPTAKSVHVSRTAICSIRFQANGFALRMKGPFSGLPSANGLKSTTTSAASATSFGLPAASGLAIVLPFSASPDSWLPAAADPFDLALAGFDDESFGGFAGVEAGSDF